MSSGWGLSGGCDLYRSCWSHSGVWLCGGDALCRWLGRRVPVITLGCGRTLGRAACRCCLCRDPCPTFSCRFCCACTCCCDSGWSCTRGCCLCRCPCGRRHCCRVALVRSKRRWAHWLARQEAPRLRALGLPSTALRTAVLAIWFGERGAALRREAIRPKLAPSSLLTHAKVGIMAVKPFAWA